MAWAGQALEQSPQTWHFSRSILISLVLSSLKTALKGQTKRQMVQTLQ